MDPSMLEGLTPEQLAEIPGYPLPNNHTRPNFDNPETIAPGAMAAISIFTALMIIVVTMRLYARLFIVKRPGLDDWTALLAALFSMGLAGTALYQLGQGWFGPHTWNVRLIVFLSPTYNRLIYVLLVMVTMSSFLAKTSILLLIQRVFPRQASPKSAIAIWFALALNTTVMVVMIIYVSVVCAPRPSGKGQLPAQCTANVRTDQGVASAVTNAVLDLLVLGIATPSIWTLQMQTKKKVGILAVLAVGLVACALSIASLYYRTGPDPMDDPARKQTVPLVFTVLEPVFGVIAACLPVLPAFFLDMKRAGRSLRGLFSRLRTNTSMSKSRSNWSAKMNGHELNSVTDVDHSFHKVDRDQDRFHEDIEQRPIVSRS